MRVDRLAPFIVAALVALTACQGPDVGQKCALTFPLAGVNPSAKAGDADAPKADYLETGPLTDCEALVCMVSPPSTKLKNNPYCSKPCVSNGDCSQSETGLQCRQVVLDPAFINALDPKARETYLGQFAFSNYCAAPLQ